MAKATRMQNGLRCTYIVARYAPAGNVLNDYNKSVMKGQYQDRKVCGEIMQALAKFEIRNKDKAAMVEKEKQHARIEFMLKLKVSKTAKITCRHACTQKPLQKNEILV